MKKAGVTVIGRAKYDYYGGKRDLIQLLVQNEIALRQAAENVSSINLSINELRHAIKEKMWGWPLTNLEVLSAILRDTSRLDGDVVVSKNRDECSICFHNKELLSILELVYSKLSSMADPATKPPIHYLRAA